MTVDEQVYWYAGRTIVLVTKDDGDRQPMYRSSGFNSGMPGKWLPFDGIYLGAWFDKSAYCTPRVTPEFQRTGTPELVEIGSMLGSLDIEDGRDANWQTINRFLGYKKGDYED